MPKTWAILLTLLATLALTGCARKAPVLPTPAPQPTPTAPAFVAAAAAVALPQLVASERDAAIRGDRPLLAQLWAPDARIVDSRGTSEPADDFSWSGRAAILNRYDLAVFPSPPPAFATPPAFTPQVAGDIAAATLGNDAWRFQWDGQRWWLLELQY
jgi:hypothetical protein